MSTGDMRSVVRLLTAVERTQAQERMFAIVRERCEKTDARLREQGIDLEVSVSRALEELVEGTTPSAELCPSYTYAFHEAVAPHFSDTTDLGVWHRPSWFYALDTELARLGVPAELLPASFLFSGPPLRLPHPGDAMPQIGVLPVQRAAALAEAYERVLRHVDPEFTETVGRFAELMRFEAAEWETTQRLGRTDDTIFFWFC
ncbi:hypothetical protein OG562_15315 [Streptomyces sp. NBC_01275]|uniref:DUF7691 family protein n=1 Tax=Streptomyces sp. NBC_01275 TaxID=2903807 RepID=UPI00225B9176|nr:hypothetical protein [Streptomyces sp. NBC_01275]MCX4762321.1 hypothetical protein [Streptomyces sp. NBC_01275]